MNKVAIESLWEMASGVLKHKQSCLSIARPLCDNGASCFIPLAFNSQLGDLPRNFAIRFGTEKTRVVALPGCGKTFRIRLLANATDIRTDRQTDRQTLQDGFSYAK